MENGFALNACFLSAFDYIKCYLVIKANNVQKNYRSFYAAKLGVIGLGLKQAVLINVFCLAVHTVCVQTELVTHLPDNIRNSSGDEIPEPDVF